MDSSFLHVTEKCLCNYSAAQKERIENHIRLVHEGNNKRHKCPNCEFSTVRKYNLKMHISAVHEKNRPHQCPLCEYSAAQKKNLTQHEHVVHIGKFKCHLCEYSSCKKMSLTIHIQSKHILHEGNKTNHLLERNRPKPSEWYFLGPGDNPTKNEAAT
jgi:KRAB domain-containing zinc finger protein